jgi:hypothetical protein
MIDSTQSFVYRRGGGVWSKKLGEEKNGKGSAQVVSGEPSRISRQAK